MKRSAGTCFLSTLLILVPLLETPSAGAATGDLTLASTSDAGIKGNNPSSGMALSTDGTKVAFLSTATNLDPADTDSLTDVYVKNLVTGDIILASTSSTGIKGNANSLDGNSIAALSADGTRVAFWSAATNLDPADTDSILDVYVKDLTTGELTLASTSSSGVKGNDDSGNVGLFERLSLSGDGTKVAFDSMATNLDPVDTRSSPDVYVKDLISGELTLASTTDTGGRAVGSSFQPFLSSDGTHIAFGSLATNLDPVDTNGLGDVYVKDLITEDVVLGTTSSSGGVGNGQSFDGTLSADGTMLGFSSSATNLNPSDTDVSHDVYVKDLVTGELTLASTSSSGVKDGGRYSNLSYLSADGSRIGFSSEAELVPEDVSANVDVYVKNVNTGDVELASASSAGVHSSSTSFGTSLSFDGTKVAFFSYATNLDPADTDQLTDIYVKDLGGTTPACTLTGTSSNDVIKGTPGSDVICGLGGDDQIKGLAGDDTLFGGPGNDVMIGGAGSDVLRGEENNDTLRTLDGISGNDTADGGAGTDKCKIDVGDTTISCP